MPSLPAVACFLPSRANDLSAPSVIIVLKLLVGHAVLTLLQIVTSQERNNPDILHLDVSGKKVSGSLSGRFYPDRQSPLLNE